jgi:surface antigen
VVQAAFGSNVPGVSVGHPLQTDTSPADYRDQTAYLAYYYQNPFWYADGGSGGQCTAFCWGRAKEKKGISLPHWGDAQTWWSQAQGLYLTGSVAEPNSIAVWSYASHGHVAFIEDVDGNQVTFNEANTGHNSNYNWGCGYVGIQTRSKSDMDDRNLGSLGDTKLLGYIYLKYSGGSGTAGDPYQIANKDDLLALANDINDYNKCFILTANIDMQGQEFATAIIAQDTSSSVGFQGTAFTGTFDGNGHKITHFIINGNDYLGLFGQINPGGSVKNLGLENCSVIGSSRVGGLVGYNYHSSISNCYSTGTVSGSLFVGGLVGLNMDDSTISNCYSTSTVSGSEEVGGLVGDTHASISNCYSTGVVNGSTYVGGLVGYCLASISNCYSTGSVSGSNDSQFVGGLVGKNGGGGIRNCYSTGQVSGSSYVGGLVGDNEFYVLDSFWDIQTSGQTIGIGYDGSSAGVLGKTTAQMKTLSTFTSAGWDFSATDGDPADWMMLREGEDYPRLACQPIYAGDIAGLYGVNTVDFAVIAAAWQSTPASPNWNPAADLNSDGVVNFLDILILSTSWLEGI